MQVAWVKIIIEPVMARDRQFILKYTYNMPNSINKILCNRFVYCLQIPVWLSINLP